VGTHGGGHQHEIIRIFTIGGNKLTECDACFPDKKSLVIEYPRSKESKLTFNDKTNEISYNEFKFDGEEGYSSLTGKIITLKLKNGIFSPN
jgi:hypothetical protein